MSGLLQRLAWRALGRPAAFRPIIGRNVAVAGLDSAPRGERQSSTRSLQPVLASKPADVGPATIEATGATRFFSAEPGAASHRVFEGLLGPGRPAGRPSDVLIVAERTTQATLEQTTQAPQSAAAWSPDDPSPAAARAETASPTASLPLHADKEHVVRRGDETSGIGVDPATSLVPMRAAVQASVNDVTRGLRGASIVVPARTRDDVTEVHVTIGRIELTAAPPATRPRGEPVRPRKAQSLEEYLARREATRR